MVDLYLIQYYNQGQCSYDSYNLLFINSDVCWTKGTSVKQLIERGIPANKIVVGKPSTENDATNTGYV